MPPSPTSSPAVQAVLGKLANELTLARIGSDEALIPCYSLVNSLGDALKDCPTLLRPIERARLQLEACLQAGGFDADTLASLAELIRPAPLALTADSPETDRLDGGLSFDLGENRSLLVEFEAEAIDHLALIEASLLALEQDPQNSDAIHQAFRSFHTLKGVAGFLHLGPIHRLAHEVESVLELARHQRLAITPALITLVLRSLDATRALVAQVSHALAGAPGAGTPVPVSTLLLELRVAQGAPHEATGNHGASADSLPEETPAPPTSVESPGMPATLRVHSDQLDAVLDGVGELVIAQSQILECCRELAPSSPALAGHLARLGRITKDLQRQAMAMRLVPAKPAFQKVERWVRDLSHALEKKVTFESDGEDTAMDRKVVEELSDALLHMVRNSLDHGIERPETRLAAGKPAHGTVRLRAGHRGSHLIVELSDDGRGIDPDRVWKKARERGLVQDDRPLTREQILQLIFTPGFSTADTITDISGRGVGMDVVRGRIEQLRGSIEIETETGRGTTFRIQLPLTLAIIDGLVVRVGPDRFVLPSLNVQMALRPAPAALSRIQGSGEVLDHRGRILPIDRLHRRFKIPGAIEEVADGIVVVVETPGKVTAVLVDEMLHKQEVVVKNLSGPFAQVPGIAGGAILGDGQVALILDPASLFAA